MGYRISKVYTRTGDNGSTGLATGRRVAKNHPLIEAMGSIDELNAQLGALKATLANLPGQDCANASLPAMLTEVQHQLFNAGGDLALPGGHLLKEPAITALEQQLDAWNSALHPLENFVLPGGSVANAQAHLARAVARRAERAVFSAMQTAAAGEPEGEASPLPEAVINPQVLAYLNRLGDWLFVLARLLDESPEILWAQQPG